MNNPIMFISVSSVPMHNVIGAVLRNRRMSMEDYDKPARERKLSTGMFQIDQRGTPVDRRMSSGVVPDRRLYTDAQSEHKPGLVMSPERRGRGMEMTDGGMCRDTIDRQPLIE